MAKKTAKKKSASRGGRSKKPAKPAAKVPKRPAPRAKASPSTKKSPARANAAPRATPAPSRPAPRREPPPPADPVRTPTPSHTEPQARAARAGSRPRGARALATRVSETPSNVQVVSPGSTRRARGAKHPERASSGDTATRTAPVAVGTIEAKPSLEPVPDARQPDLASAIQRSRIFFASHNLGHLASAIPTAGAFDEAARTALADAALVGLDDLVVFPPVALQRESFQQLLRQLAQAPASGLANDQQYAEPWAFQPDQLKQFAPRSRPSGAYALAISTGPFDPETAGRTGAQLDRLLEQWNASSLTIAEYLVLQRMRAETHNDHRFDLNPSSGSTAEFAQWQWLLDSREGEGAKTRYAMASWNPKLRRVEIGICPSESASPRKGAHATRIVPATA